MKTVKLGETGLEVSCVGFGGIPIQRLSEAQAIAVVQRSLDLGITFIDTANAYTTSEARIGRAIVGRRDRLVLATKTGAQDKATALEHLELSLRSLNTEWIDLWQLHNVSSPEAFERILGPEGAMEAVHQALRAGKIRHIGVTSHSLEMALELVATGCFETIQFPFNFVTNEAAEALLPLSRSHGLGFIAMKPFAGGLLNDANLAIKYLLQFEGVVPDPGIETCQEIDEIVGIVNGPWALSAPERAEMERIRAQTDDRFCRRCEYCLPCPQGVGIPVVMNLHSFWKRFPPERFFSGFVAEAVESARSCVLCGECEEKCPYDLPIQEMLSEKIAFYESVAF